MSRIFNFSAGPAMLPAEVMARAGDEMLDWHGSGMSVMEMSHRGKEFIAIYEDAERDLRELLAVPENYKILFLQGGATLAVRENPHKPAARQGEGGLRRHRRVVEESREGSEELLRCGHRGHFGGQDFTYASEEFFGKKRHA